MPFFYQMHCTNILIGVYGAGMEWYQFLPADAAVMELGWHRWAPLQWNELALQRGLLAQKMGAYYNVTFNWNAYMKANGLMQMTERDKNKTFEFRGNRWNNKNPFKFADGIFDIHTFITLLQKLVSGLTDKFDIKFK